MFIVYRNLESEIKKRGSNREKLSKAVGISYTSFSHKMSGKVDFKRGEMVKIQEELKTDESLDYLFQRED